MKGMPVFFVLVVCVGATIALLTLPPFAFFWGLVSVALWGVVGLATGVLVNPLLWMALSFILTVGIVFLAVITYAKRSHGRRARAFC